MIKQAKFLLRHLITDLAGEVEFTSYFSCMAMIEALNGTVGNLASYLDYGYFGVLGADSDENGKAVGTYTPKPSYYALQCLCSVMAEDFDVCDLPAEEIVLESIRLQGNDFDFANTKHFCFKRANGSYAVIYWAPKIILTETYEGTVSLKLRESVKNREIYLTNLLDSTVYKLSESMAEDDGILTNIPVLDSPLMLTFGKFFDWEMME